MKHGFMALGLLGLTLLQPCAAVAAPGAAMDAVPGSPPAADFTLPDPSGREHSLSDYRGRVVLVNFWATWCAPCREEMPAMDRLYRALGDHGLEILAVHAGPGGAATREFLERIPVSFTVLVDADLDLRGWQVPALPTTFLVDRQGRARYRALGARAVTVQSATSYRSSLPAPTLGTIEEPVGGGGDGTVGATGCADVVGDRAAAEGERPEPGRVLRRRGVVGQ